MDTIYTFLENMFAHLPKTAEVLRAKEHLYQMMIEKYDDYKQEGQSEHAAIGNVIAEFGNISELLEELGIEKPDTEMQLIDLETTEHIIKTTRSSAKQIALGVLISILGVATMILVWFLTEEHELRNLFTVLTLLLFVLPAVGLFVWSGLELSKAKEKLTPPYELIVIARQKTEKQLDAHKPKFQISILISVLLFVIAVAFIVISAYVNDYQPYFIFTGFTIAGIGVYIITLAGIILGGFNQLLNRGDYAPKMREANRLTDLVATIVFPLTAIVYMVLGFTTKRWDLTWIIWPAVGMTFGIFASVVEEIHKNKK